MPTAHSLLPARFADGRHEAIEAGAAAAGFRVRNGAGAPMPGDVLLTWNFYGSRADTARGFQAAGAHAIVCEEAYIREVAGEHYFAMALGGHNGAGRWRVGAPERWAGWGIAMRPWRRDGAHVLVCGQRGFGYNDMAMPDAWPDEVYGRLRRVTERPLWFRPHPKRRRRETRAPYDRVLDYAEPLAAHLAEAWAVVVYSSNCATEALIAGVPVVYEAPHIVTAPACRRGIQALDAPFLGDRLPAFARLAWAQWSMTEIARGVPFRQLLG